jgi:hypothetical protein
MNRNGKFMKREYSARHNPIPTAGGEPASYQLPATSYQLPATSYQPPATSYQPPAATVARVDVAFSCNNNILCSSVTLLHTGSPTLGYAFCSNRIIAQTSCRKHSTSKGLPCKHKLLEILKCTLQARFHAVFHPFFLIQWHSSAQLIR